MDDNRFPTSCVESASLMPGTVHGQEAGFGGDGAASFGRGQTAQTKGGAGRGGQTAGCFAPDRQRLGTAAGASQWSCGQAQGATAGGPQAGGCIPVRGAE